MSKLEFDVSVRIASAGNDLSECYRAVNAQSALGQIKLSSDKAVLIAPLALVGSESVEEVLEKGVQAASDLLSSHAWPSNVSITVWITLSSPKEFVGIVVPSRVAEKASKCGADLVFSVYCNQPE